MNLGYVSDDPNDVLIEVDSKKGKELGFTSDVFYTHSFLVEKDGALWISFVAVKEELRGKGIFTKFLNHCRKSYTKICIPTPFPVMEHILKKYNAKQTREYVKKLEDFVDVGVIE